MGLLNSHFQKGKTVGLDCVLDGVIVGIHDVCSFQNYN